MLCLQHVAGFTVYKVQSSVRLVCTVTSFLQGLNDVKNFHSTATSNRRHLHTARNLLNNHFIK